MFVPVASALTGAHRNHQVLASNAQQPEIQPLKSRGQIVSADSPLLTDGRTDGRTHNYLLNMIRYNIMHIHACMYIKFHLENSPFLHPTG